MKFNSSNVKYIVDDKGLKADDFLNLAQKVWPGSYNKEMTLNALARTILKN